ncbi:hypothetical protein ACFV3R_21775 [Streptomyces sp. NPDC059740]|uniref:hypothetical protein n=1 Tax=Streptomyces sp. NPDC059740 TaxID=3346926 RepID=UPI0036620274
MWAGRRNQVTITGIARSPSVDQQPTAPRTDLADHSAPPESSEAAPPTPDPTARATSPDPAAGSSGEKPGPGATVVDVPQAEAALVENYPRLARLAYLVLPPRLGRHRRVLTAHAVVQRALPRKPVPLDAPATVPAPRGTAHRLSQPAYSLVRLRVLSAALAEETRAPRLFGRRLPLPPVPTGLPQVWGLRVFPPSGGVDELAVDQALAGLSAPARAAYVLRVLERLDEPGARAVLAAAGVVDPHRALTAADAVSVPGAGDGRTLLESAEFDPCSLQARPTDLMRRRQRLRVAGAAGLALAVGGVALWLTGGGWGADGAAAPPYSRNPAAQAALDPAQLTHAAAGGWRDAERRDFSVWPARGERTSDRALLRRALAVWARPGATAQVSAAPDTPTGPPAGPPRLLFAGVVDRASVVLFADGSRVVRYAEAADGDQGGVALDFARVDGADEAAASALVVNRADGNVRFLTAPWAGDVRRLDLAKPSDDGGRVAVDSRGVTEALRAPGADTTGRSCDSWPALLAGGHVLTDLGELTPARLTYGEPAHPGDATSHAARTIWARTVCHLPAVRSRGVRTVNSWPFAAQRLPATEDWATWVCTRAATWRGDGSRVMAQFQPPLDGEKPYTPGGVAARAEDSPACGPRSPRVLAGVLWQGKGAGKRWYLLAAGSDEVRSIKVSGGVSGHSSSRLLAVPASGGSRAELTGELKGGGGLSALR